MISKLQDLQQAIYLSIIRKEAISAQQLSKLQTIIFLQNLQENSELEESYYEIVKRHIKSYQSIQQEQLEILINVVYYLGIFINQQHVFTNAFKIIKENLLDHSPVIHNSLFLHILQACGSQSISIKQGMQFVNIDNNQYFIDRFLQPYIETMISKVPELNIIEFIEDEQERISKLHSQSFQYVIHALKLHIIQLFLKKVNFEQQNPDLFILFTYLQIEDTVEYQIKRKMENENNKENQINPFYQLALLYKSYLKQIYINDFQDFFSIFKKEKVKLNYIYKNQKHMVIAFNEFTEEYLQLKDITTDLFESQEELVGQLTQCMIQSTDHFNELMIQKLFSLVSPFRNNFDFEKQHQKVIHMEQFHHRFDERLKLKELQKYINLASQQFRPLYLPYPNFISQTNFIIKKLPRQLHCFLPQSNDQKVRHYTYYGYAEVQYKPKNSQIDQLQFTLVLSTTQLITLCNLENNDNSDLDQKALRVFRNIGLIDSQDKLIENWLPKHKSMILYN